jgi:uncharacterized protein YabE (DUF348 family)
MVKKFFQLEISWLNYHVPLWAVLVGLAVALLSVAALALVNLLDSLDTTQSQSRLVTIYDQGTEKTVLTDSATVADVLRQAGVATDSSDTVEPALDTFLVANSYSVNIYRSRPVVVLDGEREIRVVTAAQTGKTIAKIAGVQLNNEDEVVVRRNDDVLVGDGAIIMAEVDRAVAVNLVLYGQANRFLTQAETVGEFLREKGINTNADVYITPSQDSPITPDLEIKVWREGVNTVTVDEVVAFGKREVQSNDLLQGYNRVETAGQNGRRSVTYEVVMQSGQEVSRKEIQSVVTLEPVEQVELVGIKVPYSGSHEDWLRAVGIPSSEWSYVDFIISRESGWGPTKSNYAGSGAYGLCQALPGSKMSSAGADWATNPVTQLKWCDGYAKGRYGSWSGAYSFWINNHWW